MSGGGFFVTARKVFDHPLFAGEPYNRGHAWLWLVSEAAWADGSHLKRGQVTVSLRVMANRFGWSLAAVRRFIERLKTEQMIVAEAGTAPGTPPGTGVTVITICNYNKYQARKASTGTATGTAPGTLEKEEKETKEKKKENIRRVEADHDHFFEEFWNAFPKRDGDNPKAKARTKFHQLAKAGTDPSSLIVAAQNYARLKHNTERKFIPQAITWLNQQRWEDVETKPELTDGKTQEEREIQEIFNRHRVN